MKKLVLLCASLATLGACKKTSEPVPATTRVDLLTAKSWRLSTATVTANGLPVPTSLVLPACTSDDTFKFNLDKTVIQDAGATKCNSTDPQTQNGTWSFNNDQSKLTIAIPGSLLSGEADIKELTSSTLRIYGTPTISGFATTIDATFVPN
jgi:outer membrane usher protein FimD/PapC